MKTIQLSKNWMMSDNQVGVYPHNRILLSNKKEWATYSCYHMDKPWKYCKRNKLVTKDCIIWLHYCVIIQKTNFRD